MNSVTDFLVIGSGVAGIRAAVALSTAGRVTVLTKDRLAESNTEYAQGGVAVALSDDDEIDLHVEDTLVAGAGLCDEEAVRILAAEGPGYITELIAWGAQFDREDGELAFTREAAHSRRRILHAHGDSTGSEIVRALLAHARRQPGIEFMAHAATLDLLVENGRCVGVRFLLSRENGARESELREIRARAVILATGGAGQIYAQTTNPEVATGDGIVMAWEAGAEVCDLEFFQFHPTALAIDGAPRFLLSEALRGEGGLLRNQAGENFMARYDQRAELAPRDIVSRSIRAEMERTGQNHVYLDMTHLAADYLRERFPKINQTCLGYGLDLTRQPIPVSPAAHYLMGGVRTDIFGRTTLPGLYAAGEVACTGVHGANRLASNSLLEGLVFGARAGKTALTDTTGTTNWPGPAKSNQPRAASVPSGITPGTGPGTEMIDPTIKAEIQDLMWRKVGLIRERNGLREALAAIERLAGRAPAGRSLNFVTLAHLITRAALWREESRGGHFRADFTARDDEKWRIHSVQHRGEEITGARIVGWRN
jgi:L-aspartate oxidase